MSRQKRIKRKWKATFPMAVGFMALAVLVLAVGVWGIQSKIAGAIIATGVVQVESNRQVVQHPKGGVVGEILVQDGDMVRAGDVLLRLDTSLERAELAIIEGQLFEILARKARLEAERDGLDALVISDNLRHALADDPAVQSLIDGQQRLFEARAITLQQKSEQISEQIHQTENQIKGATAQLAALETQRTLIKDELTDSETLFEKGLSPAARVSSLRREEARLNGEIGSLNATVAQMRDRIAALNIEKISLTSGIREEAITTLRDLQFSETELSQRRLSSKETLARMAIRSPVSGIIYGSTIFALQSVVSAAEPVMFVIPQDRSLVISAAIDAIHVDQVHVGQIADLRFAAFDQRMTPSISGLVTKLSADAFRDEVTGQSFYRVELIPETGELAKLEGQILLPGMPVEAFIKTGDRSPLSYLAKPLTVYFNRAFRES